MRETLFVSFLVEINFSLTAYVKHTVEQKLLRNSHCLWASSSAVSAQLCPPLKYLQGPP